MAGRKATIERFSQLTLHDDGVCGGKRSAVECVWLSEMLEGAMDGWMGTAVWEVVMKVCDGGVRSLGR